MLTSDLGLKKVTASALAAICFAGSFAISQTSFAQEDPVAVTANGDAVTEETQAAVATVVVDENIEEATYDFTVKLNQLRAAPGNIELRQSRSMDSVYYAIAPQLAVEKAMLHLEFVNSVSLIEGRSQLRILNDDTVIAQFRLDPSHPNAIANIEIPSQLIEPGFNRLNFEVSQHYTENCEDFTAPELWTQINTENSTLSLAGEFNLSSPKLSEIDELISPHMGGARDFVLMSGSSTMTNDALSWGGLISQAVALRLNYIMPNISFERAEMAPPPVTSGETEDEDVVVVAQHFPNLDLTRMEGRNLLLFGLVDDLRPYVSQEIADTITTSFVGIYPLDGFEGKFAIVVSGTTAEEIQRAALAFSLQKFPFIDDTHMLVDNIDVPFAAAQAQSAHLAPDSKYLFSDLAFNTQTLSAVGEQAAVLDFNLPADFYVKESDNFDLTLDMSYGAGFRGDSVLNLYLNGSFQQSIPLNSEDGAAFRDYRIYLPARSFIPGRNSVQFRPAFFSPYGGPCISPGRDNLLLTLADSSELTVPPAERYVRQPDLAIFERTGFPYTKNATGLDLSMVVTNDSSEAITAAYVFMAKLVQVSGGSLYNMWLGFDLKEDNKTRNILLVGPVDDLPADMLENAPMQLSGEMALPYPSSMRAMENVRQADFWADFNAAYEVARGNVAAQPSEPIMVQQTGGLGNNAVMVAFESPYAEAKTLTVITAKTNEDLQVNLERLVQPEMWSQLAGDLALWRPDSEYVWVQRAGDLFHIGSIDFFELMRYHLARAPWWWLLGFIFVIPLFAYAVRALLRERRRLKETI